MIEIDNVMLDRVAGGTLWSADGVTLIRPRAQASPTRPPLRPAPIDLPVICPPSQPTARL